MRCTTVDEKGEPSVASLTTSLSRVNSADPSIGLRLSQRIGNVTTMAGKLDKLELCTRYGIQPRDLRKLDSGIPTVVPTILIRKAAIIVSVRAAPRRARPRGGAK